VRRTPLQRGKPLERHTELRRGGQLARTGRLRPHSARMRATYEVRGPLVGALLAERPWCQIRWDDGCEGRSADVHEPELRSRGADICDPGACVTTCRHCHRAVHDNPAEATRRGWMIPSGPVVKPWQVTA
jgi:hypothetical protein